MITVNFSPFAFGDLRWYTLLMTLAVTVIIGWSWWQVRKEASSYRIVVAGTLVGLPTGLLFARLFHVADNWEYYRLIPDRIIGLSGLSVYGAIIGAGLGFWLYSKVVKFSFGYYADLVTPAIIVGQAVGRVGCTLAGCCHGTETTLPWGIVYTNPFSAAINGISYQPWTIYEIGVLLMILVVVLRLKPDLKTAGSKFAIYLAIYSAWRFAGGFLRTNHSFFMGLQQAQVIALLIFVASVIFLLCRELPWRKPMTKRDWRDGNQQIVE